MLVTDIDDKNFDLTDVSDRYSTNGRQALAIRIDHTHPITAHIVLQYETAIETSYNIVCISYTSAPIMKKCLLSILFS